MASFFRVNKAFTADETTEKITENGDVKENGENGEVKIDINTDEKKDLEKETETAEKTNEEPETEVVIEKKSGKSYRSFIAKMFKRDSVSDKQTEEPVKIENDTEEDQAKEEKNEKTEVEEKPTEKEPTP